MNYSKLCSKCGISRDLTQTSRERSIRMPLRLMLLTVISLSITFTTVAQKRMENINRGLVAVRTGSNEVYVGWRMMGTDPSNVGFNVYRGGTKLNSSPITNSTNYIDNTSSNNSYYVRPVVNGQEQSPSETVNVWNQNYLSVPLQRPSGGTVNGSSYTYSPNDCSVGDLDGDGQYEIVVKWYPSNAKDNSQSGYTGKVFLDAYEIDGTQLWRVDLGWNIRAGAHYTQFIVYDLDSDGKAEVACKTADGTIDGQGNIIGDPNADYRNSSGYVLDGPEFLTVFNGQTGAAMATTNYVPARGNVSSWGDSYGNRVDRFLAGVGYFDGQYPSLLMCRGYYTRSVLVAWDWRNNQLTQRWIFDSDNGYSSYAGQGAHSLSIGDADNDGKDEVMYGAMAIDHDGSPLYNTQFNHGDATHLGDLIPGRAGLEFYMPSESAGSSGDGVLNPAIHVRDAGTGQVIWSKAGSGDIGRALTADIDAAYAGNEFWASSGYGVYNSSGNQISSNIPSINFAIWWDADPLRELLDGTVIDKWTGNGTTRLLSAYNYGAEQNNGTKANPALTADLFGDWREEVIWRHNNNQELLIFTTTDLTTRKIYTLMHDPQYRVAVAWQNAGYNQPPHPSFFIGDGMSAPPTPNITLVGSSNPPGGSSMIIQENGTGFCNVQGSVDSNNAGYTGSGFANTDNASGNGIDWKVLFNASGSHTVTFRYANGASDRPANLIINGSAVSSNISFPSTSSWTSWNEVSVNVSISSGVKDVRLEATGSGGLANIDYIEISSSTDPEAEDCSASPSNGIVSGETYLITNRNSGQAIDVEGASTSDGANVLQWPENGGSNQHWVVTDVGSGYYSIVASHSGKGLDITSASSSDGANVQQWAYNSSSHQQFQIQDAGDGYYTIVARHSGQCIEVENASTSNGANIQQWPCNDHNTQSWLFTPTSNLRVAIDQSRNDLNSPESTLISKLTVFPNPVSNQQLNYELSLNEASRVYVKIIDMKGSVKHEKDLGELSEGIYRNSLKTERLAGGAYILKIQASDGVRSVHFIKQ